MAACAACSCVVWIYILGMKKAETADRLETLQSGPAGLDQLRSFHSPSVCRWIAQMAAVLHRRSSNQATSLELQMIHGIQLLPGQTLRRSGRNWLRRRDDRCRCRT
jgi:hypothetical protein